MRAASAMEMYFGIFVIINLQETSHKPGDGRLVLNQYNQYRCLALVLIGVLRR